MGDIRRDKWVIEGKLRRLDLYLISSITEI
jgi:hypothetical protein